MTLGQARLLLLVLVLLGWSPSRGLASNGYAEELISPDQILQYVQKEEWKELLKKTQGTKDPLVQLVRARSYFEIGAYQDVVEIKALNEEKTLYGPFLRYLHTMALAEMEKWQDVAGADIPRDLPASLQDRLKLRKGLALQNLKKTEEAIAFYEKFIKERRRSQFRIDIYFELANLYWTNSLQAKALPLYQKIYESYPITDADDLAREKLLETGHFRKVETDTHLSRIQRLRRAALFERGVRELDRLKDSVDKKDLSKVNLALAYMRFSQKKYTASQKLAEKFLRRKDLTQDMRVRWLNLLGRSYARQGRFDEARKRYANLLDLKVSRSLEQRIYLRLGLMAVDDNDFEEAEKQFNKLRTKFGRRGSFNETSHWFEAWSIYQQEAKKKKKGQKINPKRVAQANRLLDQLPLLREGRGFKPQALYWQYRLGQLADDQKMKERATEQMQDSWHTNFYALLFKEKPFSFLNQKSVHASRAKTMSLDRTKPLFNHPYWRRSETFTLTGLRDWAKLELDRYLYLSRKSSKKIKRIVAQKLYYLHDWDSLVHWASLSFNSSLKDFEADDVELGFFYPDVYPTQVTAAAKRFDVPPYLIWGLMREESRFEYDVISPAGAVGLMQLMPRLGKQIARRLGEPSTGRTRLKDPEVNIRFGTYHISTLMKRVQRLDVPESLKPILVVASYNAGFNAVRRWTKELDTNDVAKFVESIPYTETRQYVKRVLRSTYVYFRLYGENTAEANTKSETKL